MRETRRSLAPRLLQTLADQLELGRQLGRASLVVLSLLLELSELLHALLALSMHTVSTWKRGLAQT